MHFVVYEKPVLLEIWRYQVVMLNFRCFLALMSVDLTTEIKYTHSNICSFISLASTPVKRWAHRSPTSLSRTALRKFLIGQEKGVRYLPPPPPVNSLYQRPGGLVHWLPVFPKGTVTLWERCPLYTPGDINTAFPPCLGKSFCWEMRRPLLLPESNNWQALGFLRIEIVIWGFHGGLKAAPVCYLCDLGCDWKLSSHYDDRAGH